MQNRFSYLYKFAFYLAAFNPLLINITKFYIFDSRFVDLFFQIPLYAIIYFLFFINRMNVKVLLFIYIFTFSIFLITAYRFGYFQGVLFIKNYVSILLLMSVAERYSGAIRKSIPCVAIVYALFGITEYFSYFYFPSFKYWVYDIASIDAWTWRPFGLHLNIHTSGALLALAFAYGALVDKKVLMLVAALGLLFTGVKLWFVYFAVVALVALFQKDFKIRYVLYALPFIIPVLYYVIGNYIISEFSFSSHGSNRMKDHLYRYFEIVFTQWLPYGNIPETYTHGYNLLDIPFLFTDSEVSLFRLGFQFGTIFVLLYIYIIFVYKPKQGIKFTRSNLFTWASAIMFLHTSQITYVAVAMVIFAIKYFPETLENEQSFKPAG